MTTATYVSTGALVAFAAITVTPVMFETLVALLRQHDDRLSWLKARVS